MNYKIETTKAFDKDIKLLRRRGHNMNKVKAIIENLASGKELVSKCRNHKLSSTWVNFWDCHIEPDWILIYGYSADNQTIFLIRTGTHSDLFG